MKFATQFKKKPLVYIERGLIEEQKKQNDIYM